MNHQESVAFSKKYLEDLLTFFNLNVEVEATLSDEVIEIKIPSTESNSLLIGRNAETLRSLQYALSTTLRNQGAEVYRVNIDVADYKKQRADKIAMQAREWIERVRESNESYSASLNPADRRIVHRIASEYDDIETHSEGEGRDRKIVIAKRS